MIPHMSKLLGHPLQLSLVDLLSFLFSNIGSFNYHVADDSLCPLYSSSPGQSLLVLEVDVGLDSAPLWVNSG